MINRRINEFASTNEMNLKAYEDSLFSAMIFYAALQTRQLMAKLSKL